VTLQWSCAARPAPGQAVSGDAACVLPDGDRALVAAVDGLGHGPAAADAAARALDAVALAGAEADPLVVLERCHAALAGTRGAAVSVAAVDAAQDTVTWAGVGNVSGHVVRALRAPGTPATDSLLLLGGVVGDRLPPLRSCRLSLEVGDLLVLATDGVDSGFADGLSPAGSCKEIADALLARFGRARDDALVLIARYLGDGG
jgi:phosphoserine phosphatase RsbX